MNFLKKYRGIIMSVCGIAGFVWTCIDTAKQTKKEKLLDEHHLIYIYRRPILEGIASTCLIIGGSVMDHNQIGALTSVAAVAVSKYHEYKHDNIIVNGSETDNRVTQSLAEKKWRKGAITIPEEKRLFFDDYSGEFFISTLADVVDAHRRLEEDYWKYGTVSLDTYYRYLKFMTEEEMESYSDIVWDLLLQAEDGCEPCISIRYMEASLDDGTPYTSIIFNLMPMDEFELDDAYKDYTARFGS